MFRVQCKVEQDVVVGNEQPIAWKWSVWHRSPIGDSLESGMGDPGPGAG